MALSEEIELLRNRVLAELAEAHDYYLDTRIAWWLVRQSIAAGRDVKIRNPTTGTRTTQKDLEAKSRTYVQRELREATFQQFLSIFESFVFDFLELWLTRYPRSLVKRMVDFQSILDLPDKAAITQLVVRKELRDVLYDRPTAWFAFLEDKAKLGCPSAEEVERFSEAKATRDVLIHNRGVANKEYRSKAGRLSRFQDGEPIDLPGPYHRETWELLRKVVSDICDASIKKLT